MFIRRFVHCVKQYEVYHFKFKYSKQTLTAEESEQAVPYLDFSHWVSATRAKGGTEVTASVLQPRGTKGGF